MWELHRVWKPHANSHRIRLLAANSTAGRVPTFSSSISRDLNLFLDEQNVAVVLSPTKNNWVPSLAAGNRFAPLQEALLGSSPGLLQPVWPLAGGTQAEWVLFVLSLSVMLLFPSDLTSSLVPKWAGCSLTLLTTNAFYLALCPVDPLPLQTTSPGLVF